jgi:hypothetical protein
VEIQTTSAHGLANGDVATIDGILGNTAANGSWPIVVTAANKFTLTGSTGNGSYAGGGMVDGGDLGQVDHLIQQNVVPDDATEITQSSLAFPVATVATVQVPTAMISAYQAAAPAAIAALFKSFPIGGNVPSGSSAGTVPWSAVEGALFEAGVLAVGGTSYVRQVTGLTINGSTSDLTYPSPNHDAIVGALTLNVVGV